MKLPIEVTPKVLYVINHSAGKDSQAMYLALRNIIPRENLVIIHADLPGVDWPGNIPHIEETISHEFHVVRAKKTFWDMIFHRKMFPSPQNRNCTSDLKRGPISSKIIGICNERGFDVVVNCMGIRAEESPGRAKKDPFIRVDSQSNSKRTWYQWFPIFDWKVKQVFDFIKEHKQKPHWAYKAGMTRLSCCFCIMASKADLLTAKKLMPELFAEYCRVERELDQTMLMPSKKHGRIFLDELKEDENNQLILEL